MVAAFLTKNLEMMGKMMELDLFHQPYRAKLIPEFYSIHRFAKRAGAFGVAISGAGPTVICFTESGRGKQLKADLSLVFEGYQVEEVSIEKNGSVLTTLSLHD